MPEAPPCVYCRRRPADARWRPFCSDRCRMADLGHWLSGDYRVPVQTPAGEADAAGLDILDGDDVDGQQR